MEWLLPAFEDEAPNGLAFGARSEAAGFVGTLLSETAPAIARGDVEIVAIARRPGVVSKVAVRSRLLDGGLILGADHVARVRQLLDGERVEIVAWHAEPRQYIGNALGLGARAATQLFPVIQHAHVLVGEIDLRGMAGWRNLNVILASSLTGWRIRLLPIAESAAWRRLRSAQRAGAAVPATAAGPGEVEVYGLYARLRSQRKSRRASVGDELQVRITRMDPDEGRISVTDRLRSTGQLRLPMAV